MNGMEMTEIVKRFREKLKDNVVIGPFSKASDPAFIEIIGRSGFDFVIIDLEHGPNTVQTTQSLIRVAQLTGILPVVRVKGYSSSTVGEALDIGAGGIQAPQISNAEEAREVVKCARFSPAGNRGVCRFVRAAGYSSIDRFKYFKDANEAVIILQLEGREALDNLDEILSVEGVDIIFVGPYDLSQSLGVPGNIELPAVTEKIEQIVEKCMSHGVNVGIFIDKPDYVKKWVKLGVKYLSYSVDVGLFYEKCRDEVSLIKGMLP
jgi:4-hydroxy-2-oxoheptanedioate aldolase